MNKHQLTRIFAKPPELMTPRLLLRRLEVADFTDMYEYSRLEAVTRWLVWDPHPDEHYTARYLDSIQTQYRNGEFFDWAVTLRGDTVARNDGNYDNYGNGGIGGNEGGKMIGTCGFTAIELQNNRGETGYVLNPAYWGKGLATEALCAVLDFGFGELKLHRIEAKYIDGNGASRRVMEKCGMRFEGILHDYMYIKGDYRNIGICSVTEPEFRGKFGSAAFYERKRRSIFDKDWL